MTPNGISLTIRVRLRLSPRYSLNIQPQADSNGDVVCFADCEDKFIWAVPLLSNAVLAMIKISTLFLYQRIFVTPKFRRACNLMIGLTLGWFLAAFFVGADCKTSF